MRIISTYHKKLHCQIGDKSIGIEPNQITNVEDKIGIVLLNNPWITKVKEGVEASVFKPCGIPCRTEKPVEKKAEKPSRKKEKSVGKIGKLIGKKDETSKKFQSEKNQRSI